MTVRGARCTRALPARVSPTGARTAYTLAEMTISRLADLARRGAPMAVYIDDNGMLMIDKTELAPKRQIIMVCTIKSDPDVLAENIAFEMECRAK